MIFGTSTFPRRPTWPPSPARASESTSESSEEAIGEDISMEDVLGAGTKKAPVAAKEVAEEVPQVESQTF